MHTPPKKLHWYTLAKGDEYRNPSANSCGPFMTWGDLPERGVTQSVTYVPGPQWLPIETAPRDGTPVDLWTSRGRVADCRFRESSHFGNPQWCRLETYRCEYEVDGVGTRWAPVVGASNWMPLPEAPKC